MYIYYRMNKKSLFNKKLCIYSNLLYNDIEIKIESNNNDIIHLFSFLLITCINFFINSDKEASSLQKLPLSTASLFFKS